MQKQLKYNNSFYIFIIALLLFSKCDRQIEKIPPNINESYASLNITSSQDTMKRSPKQKSLLIDTIVITDIAIMKTSLGEITLGLYGLEAPKTVFNFISLANKKYYNNILIHRIAKNFIIQSGDPYTRDLNKKSEWGLGGESIYGGEFDDEINPKSLSCKIGYQKGVLAMANRGPNTNTSQFFICLDEATSLEKEWTIFGKVINGMDVVDKISSVEVEPSARGVHDGIPLKPIKIITILINKPLK